MIVFLALSASLDVTYEVPTLERGGIARPTSVTRVPGGKALNAARVAHALGAPVRVVAALGGFTGEWIAAQLADEGVDATVIPLVATTRTCTAIVETDAVSALSTDIYEPATALTELEWVRFRETIDVAPGDWVALSGSLPPGVPPAEVARLLADLRSRGARIAIDSSGEGLAALIAVADLVKVNVHEAASVLGLSVESADTAARALHDRFGVDAVVTDGVRGSAAVTAAGLMTVAPPSRMGRFPVGSGDAFLGGLLASLDDGWSAALAVGAEAAMRNALVAGAGRLAQ